MKTLENEVIGTDIDDQRYEEIKAAGLRADETETHPRACNVPHQSTADSLQDIIQKQARRIVELEMQLAAVEKDREDQIQFQ